MKQNTVDHAEDGGIGSDADAECQDSDGGEAGRFAQRAEGQADVVEEGGPLAGAWLVASGW